MGVAKKQGAQCASHIDKADGDPIDGSDAAMAEEIGPGHVQQSVDHSPIDAARNDK